MDNIIVHVSISKENSDNLFKFKSEFSKISSYKVATHKKNLIIYKQQMIRKLNLKNTFSIE